MHASVTEFTPEIQEKLQKSLSDFSDYEIIDDAGYFESYFKSAPIIGNFPERNFAGDYVVFYKEKNNSLQVTFIDPKEVFCIYSSEMTSKIRDEVMSVFTNDAEIFTDTSSSFAGKSYRVMALADKFDEAEIKQASQICEKYIEEGVSLRYVYGNSATKQYTMPRTDIHKLYYSISEKDFDADAVNEFLSEQGLAYTLKQYINEKTGNGNLFVIEIKDANFTENLRVAKLIKEKFGYSLSMTNSYETERADSKTYDWSDIGSDDISGAVYSDEPIIYGDLNNDKHVDMSDLTDLSLYLLKDKVLNSRAMSAADVQYDGLVNMADLATLKQFVMNVGVTLGPAAKVQTVSEMNDITDLCSVYLDTGYTVDQKKLYNENKARAIISSMDEYNNMLDDESIRDYAEHGIEPPESKIGISEKLFEENYLVIIGNSSRKANGIITEVSKVSADKNGNIKIDLDTYHPSITTLLGSNENIYVVVPKSSLPENKPLTVSVDDNMIWENTVLQNCTMINNFTQTCPEEITEDGIYSIITSAEQFEEFNGRCVGYFDDINEEYGFDDGFFADNTLILYACARNSAEIQTCAASIEANYKTAELTLNISELPQETENTDETMSGRKLAVIVPNESIEKTENCYHKKLSMDKLNVGINNDSSSGAFAQSKNRIDSCTLSCIRTEYDSNISAVTGNTFISQDEKTFAVTIHSADEFDRINAQLSGNISYMKKKFGLNEEFFRKNAFVLVIRKEDDKNSECFITDVQIQPSGIISMTLNRHVMKYADNVSPAEWHTAVIVPKTELIFEANRTTPEINGRTHLYYHKDDLK